MIYILLPSYLAFSVKLKYQPFHKTLTRSSAFLNWISVKFYETGCMWTQRNNFNPLYPLD